MSLDLSNEELAYLRDLHHMPGWQIYMNLAHTRIGQMTKSYLHENLTPDQAWEARARLQGVMDFQALLEETVTTAVDLLEQKILQAMYKDGDYGEPG